MRARRKAIWTWLCVALGLSVGLHVRPAWAGPSAMEAAGRAPANADVILVLDDARAWRASGLGRSIVTVLDRTGAMREVEAAWAELARGMGMEPEEAFDRLAGHRVVFTGKWSETAGMSWAVRTVVDGATERQVRARVAGGPRDVVGGRQVVLLEGGAFELVVTAEEHHASLLMGPAPADSSLLRDAVRALERGQETFSSSTSFRRLSDAFREPSDLVLFVRQPDQRADWIGVSARRGANRIEFGMMVEAGAGDLGSFMDLPVWSKQAFESLAQDAIAVIFDMNLTVPGEAGGPSRRLLTLGFSPEGQSAMGDRMALLLRPSSSAPMEVAVAFETTDASLTAREGDRALHQMLMKVRRSGKTPEASAVEGEESSRFAGTPPTAVRSVDLRDEIGPGLSGLWRIVPRLTWRTRITDQQCNPGQSRGWWTVGLGGRATDDLGRILAEADCAEQEGLPWVSLGMVKPGLLMESLRRTGLPLPPALLPLEKVEHVRWQAARMSSTTVIGTGEIVMRGEE